jgi:sugar phosphate isomerase/epimerase
MVSSILKAVYVNVPFCMLHDTYLDFVLENRINPEIGLDAEALDTVDDSVFRKCADALRQRGSNVTFHGPFVDLAPGSKDPGIRAVSHHRCEQVLRLVSMFRPKTVVCHSGYEALRHGEMKAEWLENSLDQWRWFSQELQAAGSRLVLENVFEKYPEDLIPLFVSLGPGNVGFCFDVGHQAAFSNTSLTKWLEVMGPYLIQLHLHDNDGDYDSHLAMGRGSVAFDILFDYLRRIETKRPLITLEPHVDADLWPSLEYLEAHWPWERADGFEVHRTP